MSSHNHLQIGMSFLNVFLEFLLEWAETNEACGEVYSLGSPIKQKLHFFKIGFGVVYRASTTSGNSHKLDIPIIGETPFLLYNCSEASGCWTIMGMT